MLGVRSAWPRLFAHPWLREHPFQAQCAATSQMHTAPSLRVCSTPGPCLPHAQVMLDEIKGHGADSRAGYRVALDGQPLRRAQGHPQQGHVHCAAATSRTAPVDTVHPLSEMGHAFGVFEGLAYDSQHLHVPTQCNLAPLYPKISCCPSEQAGTSASTRCCCGSSWSNKAAMMASSPRVRRDMLRPHSFSNSNW